MTEPAPGAAPAGALAPRVALPVALLAGVLLPFALAPFDIAPLAPLSFALALAALWGRCWREALLVGYLLGLGRYGVGASWVYVSIHEHGNASVPLAGTLVILFVAFLALLPALAAAAFGALRPRSAASAVLALGACQVGLEWLLTWFLTGFPWLFAGYSQLLWPLAGWAPVLGVLGVSLLTVLSGGALWALWQRRGRGGAVRGLAAFVVFAWLAGAGLARVEWSSAQGEALEVALVQGVVPQAVKWRREMREPIQQRYLDLTAPHWDADLVLWPEAALTVYARDSEALLARLGTRARRSGSTLVLGLPDYDFAPDDPRRVRLRNTAIALGEGEGRYVKQRLVPFGEYVPLEGLLRGLIEFFDLPMSRSRPGPADQPPLRIGDGIGMSMAICYEIAYGELVRERSEDAGLLATISNDTWFGDSIGPSQHLQMAQMRALELARPLIRATNDGVTAWVDHHGRLGGHLPRFEPDVLRGTVQPRTGATPYSRFGSAPVYLLTLMLLLPALRERLRS